MDAWWMRTNLVDFGAQQKWTILESTYVVILGGVKMNVVLKERKIKDT